MTRNERELKSVELEMTRYSTEIQDIWKKAEDEDRETSTEERGEVETRLKAIETLKTKKTEVEAAIEVEKQVKAVGQGLGEPTNVIEFTQQAQVTPLQVKTIGEQFVESEQFKSLQANGISGQRFSTGQVSIDTKGTLLTGTGAPGSGSGGGLLPVPQVVGGVVQKLFQRLTLTDLIPGGVTDANTVRYIVEGTATSGAAGVAEGGAKPQSTLGLGTTDEPVKKIATSLVVSDEMLEDASQVASYINGRLTMFVNIEEERQIGRGAGTNELYGFISAGRSINVYAGGTAAGNKAVQIFKALNGTRGSSFLEPEAIIIHPTDWQEIRLLTDTAGQFFGGGPFQGQYGNGSNVQASGQVTGAEDYLWNKPVIVTTALGNAGTALLGAFAQASQIFTKQGVTVEATNSHDTYFLSNLVAIRAEKREALAVYRPSAFTRVDLA